jgi:hypothetical protein
MNGRVLALDVVLSAVFFFTGKWTPALKGNQSRDLLRFLLCRLYDQSRGDLGRAQLTLAQGTLARKLGLSRQWIGELLARLQEAGWIEYYSPRTPDGLNASTIYRIGRQLKRLLVRLTKSRQKKSGKSPAKSTWRFFPLFKRKDSFLPTKNPNPAIFDRIPPLREWLQRGKT